MKEYKLGNLVRTMIGASLMAILLLGAFGNNHGLGNGPLTASDLARYAGTGFWSDPCTWDGFLTGAGVVLCATGSAGGCVSAVIGILKAVKLDNCF